MLAYNRNDGLLLVDAAYEKTAEKVQEELIRLGKDDLKYIINTHYHSDDTGVIDIWVKRPISLPMLM